MTRKWYQILLLCTAIVAISVLCSCTAEDDNPLLETEEVQEEITPPEPKPDWDDGVMTITVGRFETKEEMIEELKERDFFLEGQKGRIIGHILNENFTITPPERQYTIDVAVVTMLEAGITEPATIAEIKEVYRKAGYKPLTPEEIIEIRLQLVNQPSIDTGHRMGSFFCFLAKKSYELNAGMPYVNVIFNYGNRGEEGIIVSICGQDGSRLFYPNGRNPSVWWSGEETATNPSVSRFACAIQNTKRSK